MPKTNAAQTTQTAHASTATWVVIVAGVAAALHVGKLPPAIPVLREALDLTLVQAGFMLALVQLAGMLLGVVAGLLADGMGLRRSMIFGLLLLGASSAAGGLAQDATALLLLRALEGCGVLMATMPGPGLIRRIVSLEGGALGPSPGRLNAALSLWSMYMPAGTALALLATPWVIGLVGWAACWWVLAALALLAAALVARALPPDAPRTGLQQADQTAKSVQIAKSDHWAARLRQTLGALGPWLLALTFGVYAAQWLAVVGFLPSAYAQAGISVQWAGLLTAGVALINIVGNVGAGRLLQAHVPARSVLGTGFGVMAVSAFVAFADWPHWLGLESSTVTGLARYLAVLLFSAVGGVIPGTLFALSVRLAPSERTVGSTVGWMQQGSSAGQVLLPPLAGWLAQRVGGWHWTWALTGACALAGLVLTWGIGRQLRRQKNQQSGLHTRQPREQGA
ncbi:MFS transporter [Hylemonella gracilis str. Niagara R]|uniref:MFS transporter n=1 Tax=Hylemonella gracilis str. Niagara R TaxID=1458275 RepID=A0A016XK47_9BURK|nr:MFS transporter [Hylemonella gracilis]EYC52285.1 MFS transporter [Hylemonella gracilis str. Niagara R]